MIPRLVNFGLGVFRVEVNNAISLQIGRMDDRQHGIRKAQVFMSQF